MAQAVAIDSTAPFLAILDVSDYVDSTYHRIHVNATYTDGTIRLSDTVEILVDNRLGQPKPVTLDIPIAYTTHSLTLKWETSTAYDFHAYRLFRSKDPGVTPQSELVCTISDRDMDTVTVCYDTDNVTRYYRVFVYDDYGLFAGSNEVQASTLNAPPPPVHLATPVESGDLEVTLKWSQCDIHDFRCYQLRRGESEGIDSNDHLVATSTAIDDTGFVDCSVQALKRFYYRVFTLDNADSLSASEERHIDVSDPRPVPSEIVSAISQGEAAATITWGKNSDADFSEYCLYRSDTSGVTNQHRLVYQTYSSADTFYLDRDVYPGGEYYYRVYVVDTNGYLSASLEAFCRIHDTEPLAVTLWQCDSLQESTVSLMWTSCKSPDFSHYQICRADAPNVTPSSHTVGVLQSFNDTTVVDAGHPTEGIVFYRIFAFDLTGHHSRSNEIQVVVGADAGLVGYWSLDESSCCVAYDQSGHGNHGTIYGDPRWVQGVRGLALDLDGGDDFIDCGDSLSLNPAEQISLEAWFRPKSTSGGSGNTPIIDKGYYRHERPHYQYHLGVSRSAHAFLFSVCTSEGPLGINSETVPWTAGEWYHIVGTYDASTLKLYVNGDLISWGSWSGTIQSFGKSVRIGKFSNLSECLSGVIDEVRIYDRALSHAEVLHRYALYRTKLTF